MKKERSCGAVVWHDLENEIKILLIKHKNGGHWSFPKGHVEKNETDEETAKREILEETGLCVEIDNNFKSVVTYSPKKNVMKDVIYFSAKSNSTKIHAQEEEVTDIEWVSAEKAYNLINYETDKDILRKWEIFYKEVTR